MRTHGAGVGEVSGGLEKTIGRGGDEDGGALDARPARPCGSGRKLSKTVADAGATPTPAAENPTVWSSSIS